MNNDYWEKVFGNPDFSPHPDVMHFQSNNINVFLGKKIEIKKVDKEVIEKKEEKPIQPIETSEISLQKNVSLEKEDIKQEKVEENKDLVPVNSVVYEISDAKTEKKNFFRRKK